FDPQSLPSDDDIARPVGKKCGAIRDDADQDQIKGDADHRAGGVPSAASASPAICRLAASAASWAAAFLLHAAASDFAESGSASIATKAAAISPCPASNLTRARTAAGS